jgi:hypothetical protein
MALLPDRLPGRAWFDRNRAKIAGFLCGIAVQLAAAGIIHANWNGGLADRVVPVPSVYKLY